MFCPLHSIKNEEQYEKCLYNHHGNTGDKRIATTTATGKPYHVTTNQHLELSVKELEDKDKSIMRELYILWSVGEKARLVMSRHEATSKSSS